MIGSAALSRAQTDSQVAINLGSSFYASNQTYTDTTLYSWPMDTPASQEMSASVLAAGSSAMAGISKSASFLVIRGGKLVHEAYFHNAQASQAKNVHSASKSILSALVGIAIDEGRLSLNTKIGDVLPQSMSSAKRNITVAHLLTMTSGLAWTEDSTEYTLGSNFVQGILNLSLAHTPGTYYNYSTGDAHLLGAVLSHASGQSLHQFAKSRLFAPIGIDVEKWGRDSQGYFSGGCNLFITPREMAALGQLFLDNGEWNGHQPVPSEWVTESTMAQGVVSHYGYMWWTDVELNGYHGYRARGYGRQRIYVFPSLDIVTVITHDTSGSVDNTDYTNDFVRDYVLNAVIAAPVQEGDFDGDGDVDAADYVVWRKASGDLTKYDQWRANFAVSTPAQGAVRQAHVPEPGALGPLFFALLAASLRAHILDSKRTIPYT